MGGTRVHRRSRQGASRSGRPHDADLRETPACASPPPSGWVRCGATSIVDAGWRIVSADLGDRRGGRGGAVARDLRAGARRPRRIDCAIRLPRPASRSVDLTGRPRARGEGGPSRALRPPMAVEGRQPESLPADDEAHSVGKGMIPTGRRPREIRMPGPGSAGRDAPRPGAGARDRHAALAGPWRCRGSRGSARCGAVRRAGVFPRAPRCPGRGERPRVLRSIGMEPRS